MELHGLSSIDELVGKKVGVFLRSDAAEITSISAEVFMRDGIAFIDCIPLKKRKYVAPVPDNALIAAAGESDAPFPFAIFIHANSEAGLLITDLLKRKAISNN